MRVGPEEWCARRTWVRPPWSADDLVAVERGRPAGLVPVDGDWLPDEQEVATSDRPPLVTLRATQH